MKQGYRFFAGPKISTPFGTRASRLGGMAVAPPSPMHGKAPAFQPNFGSQLAGMMNMPQA